MKSLDALDRTVLLCRDFLAPDEASDQEIIDALTGTTVTIVAEGEALQSASAQSAVTALAGQTLGYGCGLRLVMPEVPVVGHQPPLRHPELRQGLIGLAQDLVPGGGA